MPVRRQFVNLIGNTWAICGRWGAPWGALYKRQTPGPKRAVCITNESEVNYSCGTTTWLALLIFTALRKGMAQPFDPPTEQEEAVQLEAGSCGGRQTIKAVLSTQTSSVFHVSCHLRTFNWRCQFFNLGSSACQIYSSIISPPIPYVLVLQYLCYWQPVLHGKERRSHLLASVFPIVAAPRRNPSWKLPV